MRVAMYLRVSTGEQTTENQRLELEAALAVKGWTVAKVYEDKGISGSKGRDQRPAFDLLQRDAVRGAFDVVAAWSVDRLGRSLTDLLAFLGEVHAQGIGLYVHRQAVDTTTPAGRMMFGLLGVIAEFERAMIVERIRAGHARARSQGKRIGGSPAVPDVMLRRIVALRESGLSIGRIRQLTGCGMGTIQRATAHLAVHPL